jgi:putative ABC transport system permease protein
MDRLLTDLRHAVRGLRRDPVFTFASLATIALALGANAAIFALSHALLVRPLPYTDPDRLVAIENAPLSFSSDGSFALTRFVRESPLLESAALYYGGGGANLEAGGESRRIGLAQVGGQFMATLGARPLVGRTFDETEAVAGANTVVVLSEHLWRDAFGADPAAVGRSVRLSGIAYTVVGVMPARFEFPTGADAWVPVPVNFAFLGGAAGPGTIARLRAGIAASVAADQLEAVSTERRREQLVDSRPLIPDWDPIRIVALQAELTRSLRTPLLVLFGAVTLVVLIGCVNLSGLLLARVNAREREFAVRGALGAGTGRIAQQLTAEAAVLSVAGGVLAVVLAWWTLDGIVALFPEGLFPTQRLTPDAITLAYTGVLSIVCAFVFAIAPALRATSASRALPRSIGVGERRETTRVRSALLIAEVALSFTIIAAAGLLARSMAEMNDVPLGFQPENVLSARVRLPDLRYADSPSRQTFAQQFLERVRALPGVRSAAMGEDVPLSGEMGIRFLASTDGAATKPDGSTAGESAQYHTVSDGWFEAMGIPIREGRAFAPDDPAAGRVWIINRVLADRLYPSGSAVGSDLALRFAFDRPPLAGTIVGVIDGVRSGRVENDLVPQVYAPFAQAPAGYISVVVQGTGSRRALVDAITAALHDVDSSLPLYDVRLMRDVVTASMGSRRGVTVVMSLFAVLALLVSAVGLYGVVAQSVARRRREIGVRIALGARRSGILRLVVRRGLVLAGIGSIIGLAGSIIATRALRSLLFGVEPTDPLTLAAVVVVMLGIAGAASAIPAARASRVDPMIVMREE